MVTEGDCSPILEIVFEKKLFNFHTQIFCCVTSILFLLSIQQADTWIWIILWYNLYKRDKRSIVLEKNFGTISFYIRRPVDRRRVEDRRFFLKQENLDHNPERRVNMVDHRIHGGKRRLLPEIIFTFGKKYFNF